MSVVAVTRNDLRGSLTSAGTWVVLAVFLLGFAGLAIVVARLAEPDFDTFLDVLAAVVALLLPLIGVVMGYRTVIDERESGTIALLMSLPHSRASMVAGKLFGRAAIFTGSLLVGALAGALVVLVEYPSFDPVRYGLFTLLAILYGLAFLALSTGLSASLSSSRRVIGAALGAYVFLIVVWNQFVNAVVLIIFRFRPTALVDPPLWAESAKFCNPRTTLAYLLDHTIDVGGGPSAVTVSGQWFASPIVAVLVLLAWIALPPVIGYLGFRRAEF